MVWKVPSRSNLLLLGPVWKDILCLFILLYQCIPSPALAESDIKSLFALKDALTEGKGLLRNWFDSGTPPCRWSGITCEGHAVVAVDLSSVPLYVPFPSCISAFESLVWLNLSGCGFSGELPEALGNLQHLQYLNLSNNQLTGLLPISLFDLKMLKEMALDNNLLSGQLSPSVAQLQHLTKLSISVNSISGGLPLQLGSLQNLEFLNLGMNMFNGAIPSAFRNLSRLSYLDVGKNNLNGSIFPGISAMVNLSTLDLSSNNLVGPIPREIGQLQNLKRLNLGDNDFTGSIPVEIGNLKKLEVLGLFKCKLTGPIPWSIGGLKSLRGLDISENNFNSELPTSVGELGNLRTLLANGAGLAGSIPKELGNCKKLSEIALSFNNFVGSIPEEFADLEAITMFNVEGNKLSGHIPDWIQNWRNVETIMLSQNMFIGPLPVLPLQNLVRFFAESNLLSGRIPANICESTSLQILRLGHNNLAGSIEETFKGCRNLTDLNLLDNHLQGAVPGYLAELPLVTLELSQNNFTGMLPEKLWESPTIKHLSLSSNQFTGLIPESIGKLSSLRILRMGNNYLEGPIPPYIGALSNLTTLSLQGNRLSGNIPLELFNCTNLVTLDLSSNNLTGHIPRAISQLTFLNSLVLSENHLSGTIPSDICVGFSHESHSDLIFFQHQGLLNLSYNRLTGQIPTAISNCTIVVELYLQCNLLNGTIPEELGELKNLATIDLSFNELVGPMLPWSVPLVSLQGLILSNNHLNGSIPAEIGHILPKAATLDLSGNELTGTLPQSFLCNKSLDHLDVSNNHLFGQIPLSCPEDKDSSRSLIFFNASSNHFSGNLDESISNFTKLTYFDIHNNSLNGRLPSAITNLSSLYYLDLSGNDLSGAIPCGIWHTFGLTFANFSGNRIDIHSLADCATVAVCAANGIDPKVDHPSHFVQRIATISGIVLAVATMLVLLVVYLKWELLRSRPPFALTPATINKAKDIHEPVLSYELLGKKPREPPSINIATFEHAPMRITADDILKATENFSSLHIIGEGGFGTVYMATLPGDRRVAVKRLHGGHRFQGERQFHAEMQTIGKVKHPNLVPLLGYSACGDERFLIYQYMEHGCLEARLRRRREDDAREAAPLAWPERLQICLGAARGLAFLHHGFAPHIIHRDMKSSNILLDARLEARVSDFGLARLVSACETHVSTDVAGTLGYIPPEYGMSARCTAAGDVYSFGVVVLELLTGLPPTGQEAEEGGGSLVGWARWMASRGRGRAHGHDERELFDPVLQPASDARLAQMARALAIARDCTADEPWRRPTMPEVVRGLEMIRAIKRGRESGVMQTGNNS